MSDGKVKFEMANGEKYARVANRISGILVNIIEEGELAPDEVCSVAVHVLSDYARHHYGRDYIRGLAELMERNADKPEPHGHWLEGPTGNA